MTALSRCILLACLSMSGAHAADNYPIVLVHGFLGFDPSTFDGKFLYWGGRGDIANDMKKATGREVFTAAVGPVSSNWDRAVELYHQIKGGCVDYGAQHAAQNKVALENPTPKDKCWAADPTNNPHRYPPALYPKWSAQNPIHLIGHSQGGQTIRTLVQLLEKPGATDPDCIDRGDLLKGGKCGWIISATTIATPHNGTTLRDVVIESAPAIPLLAGLAVQMLGGGGSNGSGFKFRLEQYDIATGPAESFAAIFERTKQHPFWSPNNRDSAQHDLSPEGAQALNSWVKTSPRVYYFSISTQDTAAGSGLLEYPGYHYPNPDMIDFLKASAGPGLAPFPLGRGMGAFMQTKPDRYATDENWYPNDGVVNTISMYGPYGSPVREYKNTAEKGTWNHIKTMRGFDHFDVIGWDSKPPTPSKSFEMYSMLMSILGSLPD